MRHLLLFVTLFCIQQTSLFGQNTDVDFKYTDAIKLSPFNLGQSEFQASYEHYLGNRRSSVIIFPSIFLRETQDSSMEGWQAMLQYRFYLTHMNNDERHTFLGLYNYGFYAGLYGLYFDYLEDYRSGYWSNVTNEYVVGDFIKSAEAMEGGAMIGVQVDITQRILLDFYIGGGIRKSKAVDTFYESMEDENYYNTYGVFDPGYTGVKPKVGFQLGILF